MATTVTAPVVGPSRRVSYISLGPDGVDRHAWGSGADTSARWSSAPWFDLS